MDNKIRLQKYIADAGVASRRKAEELIIQNKVSVNGKIVNAVGTKVNLTDLVRVNGKIISIKGRKIYIMLNKPDGYITSSSDQFGRNSVLDLLDGVKDRVFPVGRLDYSSTGLLLITNDGDLTYKLTHPKHAIEKKYLVKIKGELSQEQIANLRNPIVIDNKNTKPAEVQVVNYKNNSTIVSFTISEGRNRQVRRICENLGLEILKLKRISIGKLDLGSLQKKQWRYLDKEEIEYLRSI